RYLHRPGGECPERRGDSGRRPGLLVRSRGTRSSREAAERSAAFFFFSYSHRFDPPRVIWITL
ncbi:MAG TPA: hypothetical protein VH438_17410, partial [Gemmatimonadales bacterium]